MAASWLVLQSRQDDLILSQLTKIVERGVLLNVTSMNKEASRVRGKHDSRWPQEGCLWGEVDV